MIPPEGQFGDACQECLTATYPRVFDPENGCATYRCRCGNRWRCWWRLSTDEIDALEAMEAPEELEAAA